MILQYIIWTYIQYALGLKDGGISSMLFLIFSSSFVYVLYIIYINIISKI